MEPIKDVYVPRLWEPIQGDAWRDAEADRFWGLAVPRGAPTAIDFTPPETATVPPGATWRLDASVDPGTTHRPRAVARTRPAPA